MFTLKDTCIHTNVCMYVLKTNIHTHTQFHLDTQRRPHNPLKDTHTHTHIILIQLPVFQHIKPSFQPHLA